MTLTGIVMMVVSNGLVLWLTLFCFYRVMTTPNVAKTQHAPLDIDTGDSGL